MKLREFQEAGSLAQEIPFWGWIDNRTCLTRGGELFTLARLTPATATGLHPDQVTHTIERWQRALSNLPPEIRFYWIFLRRPADFDPPAGDTIAALAKRQRQAFLSPRLSTADVYVCWCTNPSLKQVAEAQQDHNGSWRDHIKGWLASRKTPQEAVYLETAITEASARFSQLVDAQAALVNDLTPITILTDKAGSRVLSELVNRPGLPWSGSTDSGLNWRLALSALEAERRFLRLEGEPVVLYSLLSPPAEAAPGLLSDLYRIKNTLEVTIEWRPSAQDSARRKIQSARRYYFSKRYTWFAHLQQKESTDAALADNAADTEAEHLGDALVELQSDGVSYGDIALTISLHGDLAESARLDGEIRRIFNAHDAKIIREGYGQLPVWFARLPGQPRSQQIRTVFGSSGLAACLAPVFGPPAAEDHSTHLEKNALATFETRWNTPCHYDLFDGDVGHTLVLGSTGSGKSFLLNFLLISSLQYDPRILILDLGGSYRWLTRFLGGDYLELSPQGQSLQLNPFSLPDNERSYQFLTGWVSRLLRLGGYDTTGDDPTDIYDRIKDLYALPPGRRTLEALAHTLPSSMWPGLARWHGSGAWASFFGSTTTASDLLTNKTWQVIDLAGAAEHKDLCEAALFYLLERLRLDIESPNHKGRLKIMVVDEAWRFLTDPAALSYLAEAAKTWRKHNAALILATQSAADITGTDGAEVLLESLPTKLLLSNPNLPDNAGSSLRLHPAELDKIRALVPKNELYLRRPESAGILQLNVDPKSYWLYTSSPIEAARREQAVNQYGLERALQVLSQGAP
jgi:type IV secretion system protein VirB4